MLKRSNVLVLDDAMLATRGKHEERERLESKSKWISLLWLEVSMRWRKINEMISLGSRKSAVVFTKKEKRKLVRNSYMIGI